MCAGWVSDWDVDAETLARRTPLSLVFVVGEKCAHVGRGCGER